MPVMSHGAPSLWTRLPQSGRTPCDRYKHACCGYDGSVYMLGGRGSGCLRDFWKYSVVRNEWAELSCEGDGAPEEVEGHSMVAHQGFLYVFGGMFDSAYSQSRCPLWAFDVARQTWVVWQGKTPQAQRPANRKGHSAVVLGSSMLLYGGLLDMRGSSQEFWTLDLGSTAWSQLGPQQAAPGPGPRHGHSAAAHRGCMYLFGGLKGLREQRDFWRWSCVGRTWSALPTKSGPSRLVGHAALVHREHVLVFGGGPSQSAAQSRLWSFDLSSHTWAQVPSLSGAPDRIQHCCVGLGRGYRSHPPPDLQPGLPQGRLRPFKNKCFPSPLKFLGSEGGAIELQTFSPRKCPCGRAGEECGAPGGCLTFENKASCGQWSCGEEHEDQAAQHLPDLLLVLGGRPCSPQGPITVWQMTLADS
ncbi:kelch domain-containing protein 3 [Synchiropus picturatus]